MPDEQAKPGDEQAQATAAQAKPARKRKAPESALSKIIKKYRLDAQVDIIAAGPDGKPLGPGPLLDPNVISKLDEIDDTPDKRYLDWMLYQAGGGAVAFKHSMDMWGIGTPEKSPFDILDKFRAEVNTTITSKEISAIQRSRNVPDLSRLENEIISASRGTNLHDRFQAIVQVLKSNGISGNEERIASELLSLKLKQWVRDQIDVKVRDRVHTVFVFNRLLRGISEQEAEKEWKKTSKMRQREYCFGDEDALRWNLFGFSRKWPGKANIYSNVYNATRQFIINKKRVEQINAKREARGLGEPLKLETDIGKVILSRTGVLEYQGAYPTLAAVTQFNEYVMDIPMKERVSSDVRYAAPSHQWSKDAKLYSDEYVDVMVPLTVAASVQSGDPDWPVSNPEQLMNIRSSGHYSPSHWMNMASGQHGHLEWEGSQAIPIIFHLKAPSSQIKKVMAAAFADDLPDLAPPYPSVYWSAGPASNLPFSALIQTLRQYMDAQDYHNTLRSLTKALRNIREWGQGFDPGNVIGDYVAYHRQQLTGKRGIREEVEIRAQHVLAALLG